MANDIKLNYRSRVTLTITLGSLADDATNLLTGRQSTVIDNTSNLYTGFQLSGLIKTGTSPVAGNTIEIWAFALLNDTGPVYPDTLGASDASAVFTSLNTKNAAVFPVKTITVDSTNNRSYTFGPISLEDIFDFVPDKFGFVVINGSGAALNASSHFMLLLPAGLQIV